MTIEVIEGKKTVRLDQITFRDGGSQNISDHL